MADQKTRICKSPKALGEELAKQIMFDPRELVELHICGSIRRIADRAEISANDLEHFACRAIQKRPYEAIKRIKAKHALQPPVSDALSSREKAIRAMFLKGHQWNKVRKSLNASETEIAAANQSLSRPEKLMAHLGRRIIAEKHR